MNQKLRHSGIDIIGDVPWGTHFCQFYHTKEDLLDILIPYFKAGLENNELCMWVTSKPLEVEEAKEALKRDIPDLDVYLEKGQLEIIPYTDWHTKDGFFDSDRVLNVWVEKLNRALDNGYDGLRLTGNTFWLEKEDWNDFFDYGAEVVRVIGNYRMIVICTYSLDKCNANEIIDVFVNHEFALIKREGKWEQIESSKRKEAEKTAIQAAKNWEYTIDAVPDLIAVLDTEYQIIRVNKAMAAKLGMTPEECVGLTCYHVLHGMDELPSFCPHRQLLADGLEHTAEVHEDSLDGDFIVSVSPLYNSEGKLTGCIHVARDITERKKTEKKLQKSEEQYHNLFNTMNEGFCIIEVLFDENEKPIDYVFIETNPAFEKQTGLSNVVGKRIRELIPTNEEYWYEIYGKVALTGESARFENFVEALHRWYEVNTYRIDQPESRKVAIIFNDISEHKQSERALHQAYENLQVQSEELQASNEELQAQSEELHEAYEALQDSEEKYRNIVETTNEGIWVIDAENRTTYVNKKMAEMLGYSPEELIDRLVTDFVDENYKMYSDQRMEKRRQGIDEVHENKLVRNGGSPLWVLVNSKSLFDNFGKFKGVLAMLTDITERKKAEEILEETLDNLEEQVIERTTQLEKAYKSLKVNEGRLAEAQKIAHLGNWDWNIVTNGLYWSDEIYRIFGRSPQEFGATYDAFLSYVHPEDREYVNCSVAEALKGKPYSIDHRIILANGEERIVHEQGELIYGVNGVPIRMMGTVQDITERKRLEEALELVARLPQENPNPVVRLSQGLYINYVNPAAQVLLTDWSCTIGQEAPAEIKGMAIASLHDGVHHELECSYNGHTYLLNLAPFPKEGYVNLYARDITKRRRSEEKIQILANAVESSDDAIITLSPDGIINTWNKGAEKVYGYSTNEIIGKQISILEPDSLSGEIKYLIGKIKQGEKINHYETLRLKKDGTTINVSVTLSPVFDSIGKFIAISAIARDISESTKAKKALKLSNSYNRSLIEVSLDPLVTIGHDGKITDVNASTEFVTGHSRDELIGTDFTDYFTEPEKAKKGYQEVFREGFVSDYALEIRHMNGSVTPVLYNASVYKDESGEVIGVFAAAHDITESKKAEEALRLLNLYNRSLIEASLDPLVTIGHDGKITDVNTSTELITGYSREELIGTDFTDYFTEPEKAKKGYQEVFREGFVSDYALEIRHRSGRITPILYNASVYKDESDEVNGVFAAARDITERKKAEEILKLKIEELERSNAELEQFAYVSSHDLQEPLRMISSYLQLLQRRYQGKLDEKADKYIYYAVDGAARMQNLINDLLEFSRVATWAKEPEPTDSEFVLSQTLSNLDLYIKQNNAAVTHDPLPEVVADNTQLAQVFQNLIANAIKFHGEKAPKIHISAERKKKEWLFSVKDNGIGIDPQYSEKIFEVFKRLHKKEEYPGTGIGLAICKKIVERHGGRIWVESALGKGATFFFTLQINPRDTSN